MDVVPSCSACSMAQPEHFLVSFMTYLNYVLFITQMKEFMRENCGRKVTSLLTRENVDFSKKC